ncbi:hypothetical protein AB1278_17560 [Chryseobacterium sp. NRRL B-14798]|uniref:hypothetical protein n=1 Tax=Chryseobacterium sp. NRRL B-14798 TaxID=3162880 RepID=UPI003D253F13
MNLFNKLAILICFMSHLTYGQIGINTDLPTKTLDVNGNMRIREVNTLTGLQSSFIVADQHGNIGKTEIKKSRKIGDLKYGMQQQDHAGWYLLNGRDIMGIQSDIARANAVKLLGSSAKQLWDARGRYVKYALKPNGSTGGSNSVTLKIANMPKYTVSSNIIGTSGEHTHKITDFYIGNGGDGAEGRPRKDKPPLGNNSGENKRFQDKRYSLDFTDNNWNHFHEASASTGGSGVSFSIDPEHINVNLFIYLGGS